MKGPLTMFSLRFTVAAGAALALFGTAPARAVTSTVYWDRADSGFGAGIGVSAATVAASGVQPIDIDREDLGTNTLPVTDTVSQSFVLPPNGDPATVSQHWTAKNDVTGLNDGTGANEN